MSVRPILLDLFCGAGGAAMGYHRAGFDVIGIDIAPQKNYPFEFIEGNALDRSIWPDQFDAIHASPPCQRHSTLRTGVTGDYEDLIEPTRAALAAAWAPYVIENVVGAPLIDPVRLCGSSLGCVDGDAELRRHRLFESSIANLTGTRCKHDADRRVLGVYGHLTRNDRPNGSPARGWKAGKERARRLMGVDWEVTDRELAEAIPPAYSEFIGRQILVAIGRTAA